MLIEIGFKPSNLLLSNSYKYFPTPSPSVSMATSHSYGNKQDIKYFQVFNNSRKKKLIKRSMTMPYSDEISRDGKASMGNRLDVIEKDLERLGRYQFGNPFRTFRVRKEALMKVKTSRTIEHGENFPSCNRLAVEFPMILNVGSIYSSHVIVYLDP